MGHIFVYYIKYYQAFTNDHTRENLLFKPNRSHTQTELFAFGPHLSDQKRQQLEDSEEYQFYPLIFRQIPEEDSAVLYSEEGSRPTAPVNTRVAALILLHKRGWTYRALFKHIDFDLTTRVEPLQEKMPELAELYTDADRARVIHLACQRTDSGTPVYSQQAMADQTGISQSWVSEILRAAALRPHTTDDWCGPSPDPHFQEKMMAILGL